MLDPSVATMCYTSDAGCRGLGFGWTQVVSVITNLNGLITTNKLVSIASVTDGTSNTFLIGEHRHIRDGENGALWWNWWSYGNNGDTLFCTLFSPNATAVIPGRDKTTEAVMDLSGASSYHPGGCNFAFGDGSVHFIKNTISSWAINPSTAYPNGVTFNRDGTYSVASETQRGVYQQLSTRNGGEIVSSEQY